MQASNLVRRNRSAAQSVAGKHVDQVGLSGSSLRYVLLGLTLALCGCDQPPAKPTTKKTATAVDVTRQQELEAEESAAIFTNIKTALRDRALNQQSIFTLTRHLNEYLGRSSETIRAAANPKSKAIKKQEATKSSNPLDELNKSPATEQVQTLKLADSIRPTALSMLGADRLASAERARVEPSDLFYLDSCFFSKAVVDHVLAKQVSDAKKVALLVEWVSRQVQPVPEFTMPRGRPKEVCTRGIGSPFDRAWVLLELFRQANLPSCLIAIPSQQKKDGLEILFAAVVVDGDFMLVDIEHSVLLTDDKGTPITLTKLAADPKLISWYEKLEPGYKPTVQPASLKQFSALLLVTPEMLAPRIQMLESKMPSDQHVHLFLDFEKHFTAINNVISKVKDNKGVLVWRDPISVHEGLTQIGEQYSQLLRSMNMMWILRDKSARSRQLLADNQVAIKQLVDIDKEIVLNEMGMMNLGMDQRMMVKRVETQTKQDTDYMLGLSQLELGGDKLEVAVRSFDRYLQKYSASKVLDNDILDWGSFANLLISESKSKIDSPAKYLMERFSVPAKNATGAIAQINSQVSTLRQSYATLRDQFNQEMKRIDEQGGVKRDAVEKRDVEHKMIEQLKTQLSMINEEITRQFNTTASAQQTVLQELNSLINKEDFYRPEVFKTVLEKDESLRADLAGDYAKLTQILKQRINRRLLSLSFPNMIDAQKNSWVFGSIRNRAEAFARMGKLDQAKKSVESAGNILSPRERATLQTQLRYWGQQQLAAK